MNPQPGGRLVLREATRADAMDVWAWRNDPLTRAMARSQDEVPRSSHMAWFEAAIGDPRRTVLIGECDGEKIGMVRFDHGVEVEVSINVNPACRSRGHGYALLSEAMNRFHGEVWAEIRDENLASQRLFERVGFEFRSAHDGLRRYARAAREP